jgi:hypothetical protein
MRTLKNPDYIDWQNSQAKMVILSDLEDGIYFFCLVLY